MDTTGVSPRISISESSTVDQENDVDAPAVAPPSQPVVRTKPQGFNLINLFRLSPQEQARQDRHAEVLLALKGYLAIQQKLIETNEKLDEVVRMLSVATHGGNKSLFVAAIDEAKTSFLQYKTLISDGNGNAKAILAENEKTLVKQQWDNLAIKIGNVTKLRNNTFNLSKNVKEKFENLEKIRNEMEPLQRIFSNSHAGLFRAATAPNILVGSETEEDSDTD